MRKQPFYFEIKDVMTQFVAAFNDIIISRHDRDKNVRSKIQVKYVYAPKQRVVHDLTNKARHLTLPVVAVNITGISRDESRVFNKLEGSYHAGGPVEQEGTEGMLATYHVPQPVPIDVSVSMSIMARYQTDVEQIISNFAPYSDPYIIISWKLPDEFSKYDQEIRSEVKWDGNLNLTYPDQLGATEPYRLSCDTSFTIKTWLFKQIGAPAKNIYKINSNMTPVGDDPNDFSLILPFYDNVTERSYIESVGPPLTAAPFLTHVNETGAGSSIELWGYNFDDTTAVYVSGSNINQLSAVHVEPFPSNSGLSALYPSFSGVPVSYDIVNDYKMKIILPESTPSENVDIIIQNPGGYDTALNSSLHGKGIFLQ